MLGEEDPAEAVLRGPVRLAVAAPRVVLQQRPSGGSWTEVAAVTPGAISVDVTPTVTTQYRLATAKDAAAPIRIKVSG